MSKKVAVVMANMFEASEFSSPKQALVDAGHEVVVIEREEGTTV